MPMNSQPLEGITVLDFGQIYNGPYCGYLLAMAGARVIKVESPIGETLRNSRPGTGEGYPFATLNGNKETITLNFKSSEGQRLLTALVRKVDVLLENFRPGTMAKYGVGSDELTKINPQLIYAAGTGFGQTGPHADYLAMDVTVQAMSGVVAITGYEDEPPLKSGPALCDMLGGVHLYGAITTALFRRERSGRGAVLDISMQDSVLPTLCSALGAYYRLNENPPRVGNHHQAKAIAPYNIYSTADGYVAIICIREGHWRKLLRAMNRESLAHDDRLTNMTTRSQHMELTDQIVGEWTQSLTTEEVFKICQENEVVCAPVQSIEDVMNDPHLLERGSIQDARRADGTTMTLLNTPLRFKDIEPPPVAFPRELGQDNVSVYSELLALDEESLDRLKSTGVI